VVVAANKNDVSLAVKTIQFLKIKFATRSGGHSPNPGWSSIGEPGILIDLQKLNQLTVSADKKVTSIGPGKRWGEVYEALDPYGISVIGGRIPQVGVGGLILGGMSPRPILYELGLGTNDLLSYQADSSISPASMVLQQTT
jgi:FAD/FMN-containing dehydrogenase